MVYVSRTLLIVGLKEFVRCSQLLFFSFLIIFTLSKLGGWSGDVLLESAFNTLVLAPVYFFVVKFRNYLVHQVKVWQRSLQGVNNFDVNKSVEDRIKELEKEELEKEVVKE